MLQAYLDFIFEDNFEAKDEDKDEDMDEDGMTRRCPSAWSGWPSSKYILEAAKATSLELDREHGSKKKLIGALAKRPRRTVRAAGQGASDRKARCCAAWHSAPFGCPLDLVRFSQ